MYTNLLFDPAENFERLGDRVTLKDEFHVFDDAIEYLISLMKKEKTDLSHDLTSAERPYFRTLNYTTYAKSLMISPLQPDLAAKQIYDAAMTPRTTDIDYISFFADIINKGESNKYNQIVKGSNLDCEAVVVLPGGNKLFDHVCINKIKYILAEHGKQAVFKPHPLTSDEDLAEFKSRVGEYKNVLNMLYVYDDVYEYIKKAKIVYTTHYSETALYAKCIGKQISPITTFQHRKLHGFSHINEFLFQHPYLDHIDTIFDSYKSGLIIPQIQTDWKQRISDYVSYIHYERDRIRFHYV